MFSEGGLIDWLGAAVRASSSPGYGLTATTITLAYLWLPYMILPIYAGLERRAGLAARGVRRPRRAARCTTLRRVVLPMAFPAIVAGSIFTFSLTLGDYIAVKIVGGANQLLGNVVYDNVGAANNLPFAAAVATIPVVVMLGLPRRRAADRRAGEPVSALPERLRGRAPASPRSWCWCSSTCRWRWWCSTRSTSTGRSPGRRAGFTLHWWQRAVAQPAAPATRCWVSVEVGAAGDRDRAGARHAGRAGAAAVPGSSAATPSRC